MITLRPYQRSGLKELLHNTHFLLLWSMRLRKTPVCIKYIRLNKLYPTLISAPNSAIYDWKRQLLDHGFSENDIIILTEKQDKKSRKKQLTVNGKFFIMNHESYVSFPEIGQREFECMILDEIHGIRNPKTKLSQFYTKNFRNVKHRIGLTGTWISEIELDLFQPFKFLDHSFTFPFKDYWQCRHALFIQEKFEWIMRPQGKKYFASLINKHSNMLEYADAGVEDRITEVYRYVELTKEVRDKYNQLLQQFILDDEFVQKSTIFAAVNYVWMRQLLSGHIEDRLLNKSKLDELTYLLGTEFKNKKVVIWGFYNHEVESLSEYLGCPFINGSIKPIDREKIKKNFNDSFFDQIVINSRCMKEGTNLSSADAQIYMTVPESGLILNQSKRRIFDIDQKQYKPCVYIIARNTLDEIIMNAHNRKISCRKAIYEYAKRSKIS